MKLYYSKGACSLAPRIIINEIGIACEFETVDLTSKKTQSGQNFNTINPKGSVPTLVTNDNETLTENAVILQYLADINKAESLLPFIGNFKRYKVLEWLNYVTTELHKGFAPLFNPNMPQEIKDTIYIPQLKTKFAYLNKNLEDKTYLNGEQFTLPDAYLFVVLTWSFYFKIDLNEWPNVMRFLKDVQARKAVQQSLEEENLHLTIA